MKKKVREMVIYFYNPNKTKYCKIIINSIPNSIDVEVIVKWVNTKDYDDVELWFKSAKTYIRNIK